MSINFSLIKNLKMMMKIIQKLKFKKFIKSIKNLKKFSMQLMMITQYLQEIKLKQKSINILHKIVNWKKKILYLMNK